MANDAPEMTDMAFDLAGEFVPEGYAFALWDEIAHRLPWLETEPSAGIAPLRGAPAGHGLLLAKRTKLVMRLPSARTAQAASLSGQTLHLGAHALSVGKASERPLQPHPTLHAHQVESTEGEKEFLAQTALQLRQMNVACKWICGQYSTIMGPERSLGGYSLVLHELTPEGSLAVQRAGLSGSRRFGCGIFTPYKSIAGLD